METTTTTSPPPTSTDDFPEDPAVIPEIPDINTSEEKMLDACKQTDPSDLQKEDDKKDAQNTDTSNITEEEEEEEEEGQKQKENQEQSQPESEKKTEEKSAPMQEVHITTVETTRPENTKEDEVKERHSSEPEAGEEPSKEEAEPESSRTGGTISITSKARENAKSEGGEWVPIEVEVAHHLESLIHEEKKSDITGVLEASVKAQETMGEGLLSRIVFDAGVLGAVHNHFYARARASEAYAAATAALPPLAVGSQNLLGTSLENGLEYLKRVGRTESDNFGQMGKFLRDACKELADLRAELLADHKRCTVDNTQLVRGLYAQLEVVIGSYSAAMSGLEETQKNVKALSQPTAKDPWVAQLKYYGTLTRLNTLQAEYSSHLARLASHTKSQELRQCSLIENISKKFLAFENTAFTKIVTDIHIAEDMVHDTTRHDTTHTPFSHIVFTKSHSCLHYSLQRLTLKMIGIYS